MAIMHEESPMLAPTEISISPEMMSKVIPEATIPRTATCSRMFIRLLTVKKRGLKNPVKIASPISTTSRKNHWFFKVALPDTAKILFMVSLPKL
jgi:hypothetical protein